MYKNRFLSLEDRQKIEDLLQKGMAYSNIARALGRGYSTILCEIAKMKGQPYVASEAHYLPRVGGGNKGIRKKMLDPEEVKRLINDGYSVTRLTQLLQVSRGTFYSFCQRKGIELDKSRSYNRLIHRMNALEEKLEALNQQLDIIFDILKEKNNE